MEIREDVAQNWYYFDPLLQGRWDLEDMFEHIPVDIDVDKWYEMVEEKKVVLWSQVHTAVEFFGPKNNKWLLNTIIDANDKKERMRLYEEVGYLIRSEELIYPYISPDIQTQIHGNFFLAADPAYTIYDNEYYTTPPTPEEREQAINLSHLSVLTGTAHTAWLRQGRPGQEEGKKGKIREIPWMLISWQDVGSPNVLMEFVRFDRKFKRSDVINMINRDENHFYTFEQRALIYYFSDAYMLDSSLKIMENYCKNPYSLFHIFSALASNRESKQTILITDLDDPLEFYEIILNAVLFHTDRSVEEICYYTGLDRLIDVNRENRSIRRCHTDDAMKLVKYITLQILYRGETMSKSGVRQSTITPSQYRSIVIYGGETVGSEPMYDIARFTVSVWNSSKNKENLEKFVNLVDKLPYMEPTMLP